MSDSGSDRPPIPVNSKKWTDTSGFNGRIVPDWVDGYFRIQWTLSTGFGGRIRPEYAVNDEKFKIQVVNYCADADIYISAAYWLNSGV